MIACPRCEGQGQIREYQILSTGQHLLVCDECDATWFSIDAIGKQPWADFFTTLDEQGIPRTHDQWKLLPAIPFEPVDFAVLAAAIVDLEGTMVDVSGAARAGVREGLTAMRERGWQLACVSEQPREAALRMLEALGFTTWFDHVLGEELIDRERGYKMLFKRARAAMGSTPFLTLVLGDSLDDWTEARVAGCQVVLVGNPPPEIAARVDGVIARFDELFS
jgi:FMN phosphatase YigB (HAD superfamily)